MSLIKCEECGKEISDKALSCPNCGAKNKNNNETASKGLKIICFLIPIIGIIIFAINISTKPKYAKGCLIASIIPTLIVLVLIIVLFLSSLIEHNIDEVRRKAQVQLPDFTYLTFEEASIKANDLNLKIEIIEEEYNDKIEKGKIIRQKPEYEPDYKILSGSTIKVIISKGTNN